MKRIPIILLVCLLTRPILFGDVPFEEKLITVIPEGYDLEGPPVTGPDGNLHSNVSRVVWSPDGLRAAYVGHKDKLSFPIINNQVGEDTHYVNPPFFSTDGKHVAFRIGNRISQTKEKWWILLDGKKTHSEDWIGEAAFFPGTDKLIYWAQPGAKIDNTGFYVRKNLILKGPGKKKGKEWRDARALLPFITSSDGKTLATMGSKGDRWYVLFVTKKGQTPSKKSYTMINTVALSPNGKDFAVAALPPSESHSFRDAPSNMAMMGGTYEILHGKKTYGKGFDSAGVPVFSPNGKHLAYKVLKGQKMGVAIDNAKKTKCEYDFVFTPFFHPNSKRVAYMVNNSGAINKFFRMGVEGDMGVENGENRVISHDLKGKNLLESPVFLEIRHACYSPDGDYLAFAGRTEEGWKLRVNDKISPLYDEIGPPHFSKDKKKVAFGARSEREIWWRVLDLE